MKSKSLLLPLILALSAGALAAPKTETVVGASALNLKDVNPLDQQIANVDNQITIARRQSESYGHMLGQGQQAAANAAEAQISTLELRRAELVAERKERK